MQEELPQGHAALLPTSRCLGANVPPVPGLVGVSSCSFLAIGIAESVSKPPGVGFQPFALGGGPELLDKLAAHGVAREVNRCAELVLTVSRTGASSLGFSFSQHGDPVLVRLHLLLVAAVRTDDIESVAFGAGSCEHASEGLGSLAAKEMRPAIRELGRQGNEVGRSAVGRECVLLIDGDKDVVARERVGNLFRTVARWCGHGGGVARSGRVGSVDASGGTPLGCRCCGVDFDPSFGSRAGSEQTACEEREQEESTAHVPHSIAHGSCGRAFGSHRQTEALESGVAADVVDERPQERVRDGGFFELEEVARGHEFLPHEAGDLPNFGGVS